MADRSLAQMYFDECTIRADELEFAGVADVAEAIRVVLRPGDQEKIQSLYECLTARDG